jgi:hypothetical protein
MHAESDAGKKRAKNISQNSSGNNNPIVATGEVDVWSDYYFFLLSLDDAAQNSRRHDHEH